MMPYSRSEAVVDRKEEDGSWFLFEATTGRFRRLNAVAGMIWELCDGNTSGDEMVAHILDACTGVDPDQVTADVDRFVGELLDAGLITVGEGCP